MKNWLPPVSGHDRAPCRPCRAGTAARSARRGSCSPAPPSPSPRGSPSCTTKSGTTRWMLRPLKKPLRASVMKFSTVSGASRTASSIWIVPRSVSMIRPASRPAGSPAAAPRRRRPRSVVGAGRICASTSAAGRRIELLQQHRGAHAHRPVLVGERASAAPASPPRAPYFASAASAAARAPCTIGIALAERDTPRPAPRAPLAGFSSPSAVGRGRAHDRIVGLQPLDQDARRRCGAFSFTSDASTDGITR